MRRCTLLLTCLGTAIVFFASFGAVSSQADPIDSSGVIFSTFGPGGSYQLATGAATIGGAASVENPTLPHPGATQGAAFTPSPGHDYTLGAVTIAASLFNGPNALDLELTTDANGKPGSVIETFQLRDVLDPTGANTLLTAESSLRASAH